MDRVTMTPDEAYTQFMAERYEMNAKRNKKKYDDYISKVEHPVQLDGRMPSVEHGDGDGE